MTNEQINVSIASACGWRLHHQTDGEIELLNPSGLKVCADWDPDSTLESFSYVFPNYANDLNAMHEVEKTFMGYNDFTINYLGHLCRVAGEAWEEVHATAHQRAESFLRAKQLWKD